MNVVGLFAGIGGIELGLERAGGFDTTLLCESWDPARRVLAAQFDRDEADIHDDVATLSALPVGTEVLTAGFPCTDLSQAGRTAGIRGEHSGLVSHVFRLLQDASAAGRAPTWLVIENVPNMLQLDKGNAMRFLVSEIENLGMRWAYRVVDARFTGLPQRRRRVVLVASAVEDPREVLFVDDAGERPVEDYRADAFGFYWTEGRGGLGWAQDAVPTLKGGSTIGIPSPPGVWMPSQAEERRFVMPALEDAEAMQGFARGWTEPADTGSRNGPRWKLIGNAVPVDVADWLGRRLAIPGSFPDTGELWDGPRSWPTAAYGSDGKIWQVDISEFPEHQPYRHLSDMLSLDDVRPLSHRGITGFWSRLQRGNLGQFPGFREAVAAHVAVTHPDRVA